MAYIVSGTGTPSKIPYKWGLLKNGMKVTARLQPKVTAKGCGFSPVKGLTKIEVCDQIQTDKLWCYCRVNGLYGYILWTSIRDYLRTPAQSTAKVAQWVINDDFGVDAVRKKALTTLGYDYDVVQAKVTAIMNATPKATSKFCVWPIYFFEENEALYGDCTAVLEYNDDGSVKHCILIDSAMSGASSVVIRKLKAHGVKRIDAFVLSHGHGDHYGGLSKIKSSIPIDHIYVPDCTELDKYQKSYGNAIRNQAKKASSTFLKAGSSFQIGNIKCDCVFICPANKLREKDDHHFVNNQSMVLRFDLGGIIFHTAGDLQNEANNLLVKAVKDLKADIFKAQWHGDANATNDTICKAVRPSYAFSNYHHAPNRSGRGTTRSRLRAVGAKFYDNYTYGDIWFYIKAGKVTVKHSK